MYIAENHNFSSTFRQRSGTNRCAMGEALSCLLFRPPPNARAMAVLATKGAKGCWPPPQYGGRGVLVSKTAEPFPRGPPPPAPDDADDEIARLQIDDGDGPVLSALHIHASHRLTVFFCHGNAEDLDLPHMRDWLCRLHEVLGVDVFAFEYSGYGESMATHKPSERQIYRDSERAFRYLTTVLCVPSENVVIYGRSLGAVVCCHLAASLAGNADDDGASNSSNARSLLCGGRGSSGGGSTTGGCIDSREASGGVRVPLRPVAALKVTGDADPAEDSHRHAAAVDATTAPAATRSGDEASDGNGGAALSADTAAAEAAEAGAAAAAETSGVAAAAQTIDFLDTGILAGGSASNFADADDTQPAPPPLPLRPSLRGVVLQSSPVSAFRVALQKLPVTLPGDCLVTEHNVTRIRCKVLFIHGTADALIPIKHGQQLWQRVPPQYRVDPLWIDGADHNNIESDFERYVLARGGAGWRGGAGCCVHDINQCINVRNAS